MGSGSTVLYSKLGYAAVWIDKALGWVWIAPNLKRTTAGCPCIRPTSQPPYMVPEAGRLRPEELLYTSNRRAQGCWFESHKRMFCFFIINLAIMFVIHYICPFLVCCVRKAILMWQILIDWWLFWTFHFIKIGLVSIFKKILPLASAVTKLKYSILKFQQMKWTGQARFVPSIPSLYLAQTLTDNCLRRLQ